MARENLFKPASAIVNKVLLDEIPDDDPCPAIAKPENMARLASLDEKILQTCSSNFPKKVG